MSLIQSFKNLFSSDSQNQKQLNASPAVLTGKPVLSYSYPYGYIDRQISPEVIADDRQVPIVLSSLIGLNRVCFNGFDWSITPLEEGDDTQASKIDVATKTIKSIDKRIGRSGKSRNLGTLGLIRVGALEGWTWNKAIFEHKYVKDGQWINPKEIQCLSGQSFGVSPSSLAGLVDKYVYDSILPGIVYDVDEDCTRFYQKQKTGEEPIEIDSSNILLIEDSAMPDGSSMMKALVPLIEQWKEIRKYGMLAERRIGVPTETAAIDIVAITNAKAAGINISMDDLINHAQELIEDQSYELAKVAYPGINLQYESPSMPLNPWEADKRLQDEIINFFFHKSILEVTAQAISATNAPAKDLLDQHIASEREVHGRPFELYWTNWLELNGFDLKCEFDWWNWAPDDQQTAYDQALKSFMNGAITINEFRGRAGLNLEQMDDPAITKMIEEHNRLTGSAGMI